jgi:hypothetical protein
MAILSFQAGAAAKSAAVRFCDDAAIDVSNAQ